MRLGKYDITGTTIFNGFGVVIVVILVISLGKTITYNYQLGRQINQLNGQIALLQAQRDQLNYQIKYYGTQSYQERQARSQLNLQAPGETELILPSASPTPTPSASPAATSAKATHASSNFAQWLSFLAGHS